jgi:DNA-binding SARP family transcriptional activator
MQFARVMTEDRSVPVWQRPTPSGPFADNLVRLRGLPSGARLQSGGGGQRPGIRLHLLGSFQITIDGQLINVGCSVQRLLAILALQRHPVSRATVAGMLWDDTTDRRAQANLRTTIYRLNQVCDEIVEVTARTLRISPHVAVDVWEVGVFATQLLDDPGGLYLRWPPMDALNHDLLPDWDQEWLRPEQQRFRSLRLHCLEALCEQLVQQGRYGQAADAALAVVHADPFRESAHGQLIRIYLAEGNRNEAVQHFLAYRRNLGEELGLSPSPEIARLLDAA